MSVGEGPDAMRIAVTGSIASDHLMTFPGSFTEHLIEGHLDRVSLSFLADELEIRRGGVAANMGFGLGLLGLSPVLIGAVGSDFTADHEVWLRQHGVDTSGVRVSTERHTARFVCTTDRDHNQIATFYAGAMAEARYIRLTEVMQRSTDPAPACPECGEAKLARIVSRTSFQLKGGGWYSDLYSTPKKKAAGSGAEPAGGAASPAAPASPAKPAAASSDPKPPPKGAGGSGAA